jgi:hypothetical protein
MLRILQVNVNVNRLQKHFDEAMNITLTEAQNTIISMTIYTIVLIIWASVGWNIVRNSSDVVDEEFLQAVYWAFTTFTTVGYGDITPVSMRETIYTLITASIGAVFTASIIANVTSFLHDVDVSEDNIEHKTNTLKWFLEGHNVSLEYIEKVQEYFEHVERDQDGLNEDAM